MTPTPNKLNILYITPSFSTNRITGGAQRTLLIARALRKLGSVDMLLYGKLPVTLENPPPDFQNVTYLGCIEPNPAGRTRAWKHVRPLHPRWVDRLAYNLSGKSAHYAVDEKLRNHIDELKRQKTYDLIVTRYTLTTLRSGQLERDTPLIIDIDDLDSRVYESRLASPTESSITRMWIQHQLYQIQRIVPQALRKSPAVWVSSEDDRSQIQHPNIQVVPNIPWHRDPAKTLDNDHAFNLSTPPEDQAPKSILTVASFSHTPNARGVLHFATNIWPRIHAENPDTEFRIVGHAISDELRQQLKLPGVCVVGFVDDLAKAYHEASVFVSPIYEGGGTKIKVLEALSYAKPVVATQHSLYGYQKTLVETQAVSMARTDDEFACLVNHYLEKPMQGRDMGKRGQDIVSTQYSFSCFADAISRSIASIKV